MSDGDGLVERARAGDAAAFGELAARCWPALVGAAAMVLPDRRDAEEAAQEALLLSWRSLPGLREPARFEGWLRRIVLRRALSRRRRWRQPTLPIEGLELAAPGAHDPTAAAVRGAVAALPAASRAAATLFYLDGYAVGEVASALRVPSGTVKRRLHDARARLRVALAPLNREVRSMEYEVAAGVLAGALTRVTALVPTENPSQRHRIDALLVEVGPDGLALSATDGFGAVRVVVPARTTTEVSGGRALLPAAALGALARAVAGTDGTARVSIEAGALRVALGVTRVVLPTIDGEFPELAELAGDAPRARLTVDGGELRRAVAVAEAAGATAVELRPVGGTLRVWAEAADGTVEAELPLIAAGALEPVRLDPRRLLGLLGEGRAVLSWAPFGPVRGERAGGFWLLMPLRDEARAAA
jgi:RNA polymerase sigma-70 factor (ECF subfamily)